MKYPRLYSIIGDNLYKKLISIIRFIFTNPFYIDFSTGSIHFNWGGGNQEKKLPYP
jgi:hypothetical protein